MLSCQGSRMWIITVSQTGTNAPTLDSEMHNTLGETPVFGYDSVGRFTITSALGQFRIGKINISANVGASDGTWHAHRVTDNVLMFHTLALPGGVHANDILVNGNIKLEVFI